MASWNLRKTNGTTALEESPGKADIYLLQEFAPKHGAEHSRCGSWHVLHAARRGRGVVPAIALQPAMAEHVPGVANIIADKLSRRFAPGVDAEWTPPTPLGPTTAAPPASPGKRATSADNAHGGSRPAPPSTA